MKALTYGLALSVIAGGAAVTAEDKVSLDSFRACAGIEDDAARLACYDRAAKGFDFEHARKKLAEAEKLKREAEQMKAEAEAEAARLRAEAEKRKAEAERLRAEAEQRKAEEKARAEAEKKRLAELEAKKEESFGKRSTDFKDNDDLDRINSEITRTIRPQVGGLVVILANGQVWQNIDSKRPGPMKPGTKVHVKKTFAGGFFLINEDTGRSVRVKRLN